MQSEQTAKDLGSANYFCRYPSVSFCLQDWGEDVKNELLKTERNKNKLKEMYEEMYKNLGDLEAPGLGLMRKRFIRVRVITTLVLASCAFVGGTRKSKERPDHSFHRCCSTWLSKKSNSGVQDWYFVARSYGTVIIQLLLLTAPRGYVVPLKQLLPSLPCPPQLLRAWASAHLWTWTEIWPCFFPTAKDAWAI